eukprot:gene2136-1311_t
MSELPISPKKEKDCEVPLNSHGCAPTPCRAEIGWPAFAAASTTAAAAWMWCCLHCQISASGPSRRTTGWFQHSHMSAAALPPLHHLLRRCLCPLEHPERYNIKGNTCADCCAVYCCTLCAISQIMREMTMMNERYVAAYPLFSSFLLAGIGLLMGNREHALSFLFFQINVRYGDLVVGSEEGSPPLFMCLLRYYLSILEKKLSLKTSKFSLKTSKFQDANTVLSLPTPLALPTLGTRPQGLSYQYFVAALLEVVQISAPPEGLLALSNLLWPPNAFIWSFSALVESVDTRILIKATHAYSQPQTKPKYFRQNMSELPISPKKEKDCEVPLNSHGCALHTMQSRDWMAGFCGCFDDCCGCLDVWCCLHCQISRQWSVAKDHKVGFNIPICLLLHFLPAPFAASVPLSARAPGSATTSKGIRVQIKAWLVFFRMGNREHALSFLFFQSLRVISLYQSSCDRGSTYGTVIWWEKKLSLKTSKFSLKTSKFQDANTVLSLPTPLALPTLGTRPQGLSYQYFVAALLEVVQISAPPAHYGSSSFPFFFFIHFFFSDPSATRLSLSPSYLNSVLKLYYCRRIISIVEPLVAPTLSFGHSLHSLSPSTRVFSSKATHAYSQPQTKPKYFRQNMSELPISPKKEKDCEVPLNSHGCALHTMQSRDWMAGFCGCFDDCCGCLDVWCCLHCQISRQWSVAKDHKVGFNIPICLLLHFLPCTICCVGASVRSSTRERYNIKGNTCADCCAVYCCTLCAISQIMREMTMMNERYVAAYPPFFPPFFLLKAWLVFFRMGNREHALSFLFFQSLRVISLYQSSCDRGSTYGTVIWWEKKLSLKTSKFSLKTSKFQDANTVLSLPTPLALPTLGTRPQGLSYQYFVAALLEVVQISAPPAHYGSSSFPFFFFIHFFFSLILPQHVSLSLPRILTPFLNSITVEGLLALSNLLWPPTLSFVRRHAYSHQKLLTHTHNHKQNQKYFRQNMSELPISPKKEKDCEVPLNSHGCAPTHHAEPRDWMASFCGCFDDCCGCLDVWCCLHCQISRQWSVAKDHKVGFNIPICLLLHFLPCTICCVGASVRSSTRERYNIKGNTSPVRAATPPLQRQHFIKDVRISFYYYYYYLKNVRFVREERHPAISQAPPVRLQLSHTLSTVSNHLWPFLVFFFVFPFTFFVGCSDFILNLVKQYFVFEQLPLDTPPFLVNSRPERIHWENPEVPPNGGPAIAQPAPKDFPNNNTNNGFVNRGLPRDWMASFCGCCDDCCGCLDVWCCRDAQLARQWTVVHHNQRGFSICICLLLQYCPCVLCCVGTSIRGGTRNRYNIDGNCCCDCLAVCCCTLCAISQIMREMTMMGEFPGACCYISIKLGGGFSMVKVWFSLGSSNKIYYVRSTFSLEEPGYRVAAAEANVNTNFVREERHPAISQAPPVRLQLSHTLSTVSNHLWLFLVFFFVFPFTFFVGFSDFILNLVKQYFVFEQLPYVQLIKMPQTMPQQGPFAAPVNQPTGANPLENPEVPPNGGPAIAQPAPKDFPNNNTNNGFVNRGLPRDWMASFCGCCDDCCGCLDVWCCRDAQLARQWTVVHHNQRGFSICICLLLQYCPCVLCCVGTSIRGGTRNRYNIDGNCCCDCLAVCCCTLCAISQIMREMTMMGEFPGACCYVPPCAAQLH